MWLFALHATHGCIMLLSDAVIGTCQGLCYLCCRRNTCTRKRADCAPALSCTRTHPFNSILLQHAAFFLIPSICMHAKVLQARAARGELGTAAGHRLLPSQGSAPAHSDLPWDTLAGVDPQLVGLLQLKCGLVQLLKVRGLSVHCQPWTAPWACLLHARTYCICICYT